MSGEIDELRIRAFEPALAADFARINRQWIESMYALEPVDEAQLGDPHGEIVAPGGAILLAQDAALGVIGTCGFRHGGRPIVPADQLQKPGRDPPLRTQRLRPRRRPARSRRRRIRPLRRGYALCGVGYSAKISLCDKVMPRVDNSTSLPVANQPASRFCAVSTTLTRSFSGSTNTTVLTPGRARYSASLVI